MRWRKVVKMGDNVNHPDHYTFGDIECIDAIHAALGHDGFMAYCCGNAMKYLWRYRFKGGVESLEKAVWYIERMIEVGEKGVHLEAGEVLIPIDDKSFLDRLKKTIPDDVLSKYGFGFRPKEE